MFMAAQTCLSSEAVQSASLSFQGVHDVHGGDGLSLGVLGVGNGISGSRSPGTPSAHRGSPRRSDRRYA